MLISAEHLQARTEVHQAVSHRLPSLDDVLRERWAQEACEDASRFFRAAASTH